MHDIAFETHLLAEDGLVPNNARLPLIVYRGAFDRAGLPGAEAAIQAHFAANDWRNGWVNGIYDYHHYHATAHEVLGLARGWAEVQFGGPHGPVLRVEAGDVVFVPAGVGVMMHLALVRAEWPAIATSLLVSTVVTLVVTAWLMAWLGRRP